MADKLTRYAFLLAQDSFLSINPANAQFYSIAIINSDKVRRSPILAPLPRYMHSTMMRILG